MPTPRSILFVVALAACDAADARESLVTIDTLPGGITVVTTAAPIDSGRWTLVHERDVRPAPGEPGELMDPQDLALTDDGSLLVVESSPAIINMYGPDGRFIKSLSREGDGPGEFRTGFIAQRGDTLVVQDPRNARATSLLISDGSVVATRPTTCCYWAPLAMDANGNVVARAMAPNDTVGDLGQSFVRFAVASTVVESLVVLEQKPEGETPMWQIGDGERMMMMTTVPMQPQSTYGLHPSGAFLTGWAGEYRLRFSRDGRDTTRIFTRPWTPGPVTAAEKERIVEQRIAQMLEGGGFSLTEEQLRKSFDITKIPNQRPAYETAWSDREGRIWVRLSTHDTTAVHFDLFDAEGRWLDQLTVPGTDWPRQAWRPTSFTRDHVAVLLEDDDGLPVVRVFRIVRRED